jgi:hypothetical protein
MVQNPVRKLLISLRCDNIDIAEKIKEPEPVWRSEDADSRHSRYFLSPDFLPLDQIVRVLIPFPDRLDQISLSWRLDESPSEFRVARVLLSQNPRQHVFHRGH